MAIRSIQIANTPLLPPRPVWVCRLPTKLLWEPR